MLVYTEKECLRFVIPLVHHVCSYHQSFNNQSWMGAVFRIVAPYTRTMCVRVHVCDLDGRYHASIYRKGMFAFCDPSGASCV